MPPIETAIGALCTGALALLRTAAWVYGALVLIAAATAPLGPHPDVAAACLLPLSPLVLAVVTRSLLAGRGRELRIAPFALCAFAAGAALAIAREALAPTGVADLAVALGAVVAAGLATAAFSDREPDPESEGAEPAAGASEAAQALLSARWPGVGRAS